MGFSGDAVLAALNVYRRVGSSHKLEEYDPILVDLMGEALMAAFRIEFRADQIEISDAQVIAFRTAHTDAHDLYARTGSTWVTPEERSHEAIRAGLAAVQWALLNEPVAAEVVEGPEVREVASSDYRNGDTITAVLRRAQPNGPWLIIEGSGWFLTEIRVTRPVIEIPQLEGAVIRARLLNRTPAQIGERIGSGWIFAGASDNPDAGDGLWRDRDITEVITVLDLGREA
jgi:hypothetical protein